MNESSFNGIEKKEKPISVVDKSGAFVAVNEKSAELHGYSKGEMVGMHLTDFMVNPTLEQGMLLQKAIESEGVEAGGKIATNDGKIKEIAVVADGIEHPDRNGQCVKIEIDVLSERDQEPKATEGEISNSLDHIPDWEIAEISNNIRIDAPSGEMTLGAIMLDLAVMHNEVEQTKQGAYNLYVALDDRLAEEERRDGNDVVCDIIREAKETAFGLFLRIERGDEELHGDRPGKHSGYFD